ncbi:hypothetical protein [Flavobacterium weaverense]|uniref:Uncharacterized protein n=1 Tax=Flavobacterium weaverense TaxID=271156 RepID=A0A3M0A0D9_9FLAO|nr:hypothetical protein [Flavobacterium weaverense]RMA78037.1 hypothetical protein BC961_0403 [Flavobacterium weaverense]
MKLNLKFWLQFSLINLFIVAILGVTMRYKIGFDFPFFDQSYLIHSHSHFAFSGWLTHTIMTLMIYFLQEKLPNFQLNKYLKIIIANLICAYGMLFFFIIQGYAMISIFFSTASILVSYVFGYLYLKDLKKINSDLAAVNWFRAAVVFNVISSLGTFYLAYMMATKTAVENLKLSSIYYYLHFQYNGWFFFACIGLLFSFLNLKKSDNPLYQSSFKLFAAACIPAYFLSLLWLEVPTWVYVIAVLAALIQVYAWFKLLFVLIKVKMNILNEYAPLLRTVLVIASVSLSLKFILQLSSTIPALGQIAFFYRPIVIAYLHLILLAVNSLFLLFYIFANHFITFSRNIKIGLIVFIIGIFLNEIFLGLQGLIPFGFPYVPHTNELLFIAALILLSGIGIIARYSMVKIKS